MKYYSIRCVAGALCLMLAVAGCDLSGIEDATDDFDLIIELEQITTTVAMQVIDAESMEPIGDAALRFGGPDAGAVIDVYSDPITEIEVEEGVVTFGIRNTVLPTEISPVEFEVVVEAEGYFTETIDIVLVDSGGNNVTVELLPEDVARPVEGTSGVSSSQVTATAATGVQQPVTVSTPQRANVQASTQAAVRQGTRPLAATGEPLTGQLQTNLRVFDLDEGLTKVPAAVRPSDGEALLGLLLFGMSDANGIHALDFDAAADEACAVTIHNEVENATLFQLVSDGIVTEADVVASSIDGETDVAVGSVDLMLGEHPIVASTMCIGGDSANVDLSAVRDVVSGKVGRSTDFSPDSPFYLALTTTGLSLTTIDAVVLDNTANTSARLVNKLVVRGIGAAYSPQQSITVGAGQTRTIVVGVAFPSAPFSVKVDAYLGTGEMESVGSQVSGANATIVLPLPQTTATNYAIQVSMACSAGQKLSPQVTASSFSGLSLAYRPVGQRARWADMGKARNVRVTESSVTASADATLNPGATYEFRATYDRRTEIRQATAPSGSSSISFSLNPTEISGIDCE